MQPLISVIVTTKNSARTLERCLQSIRSQRYTPLELLVVDDRSTDETKAIAIRYADRVLDAGPERCAQRNFGVRQSCGKFVCILDSDMILNPDVLSDCASIIGPDQEAVIIWERSFGEGFWSACKILERSCYGPEDNTVAAARFFTRRLLDEIGLYDEGMIGGEDWDLSIRASSATSIGVAAATILHDEGHQKFWGLVRKKYYYGRGVRRFLRKHKKEGLRRIQPMRPSLLLGMGKIFKNPVLGFGCVLMKAGEFTAIILGMFLPSSRADSIYRPAAGES